VHKAGVPTKIFLHHDESLLDLGVLKGMSASLGGYYS